MSDPRPLRSGPIPPELRKALDSAHGDEPSTNDLARLRESLALAIPASGLVLAPQRTGDLAQAAGASAAKVPALVAIVAAAGLGVAALVVANAPSGEKSAVARSSAPALIHESEGPRERRWPREREIVAPLSSSSPANPNANARESAAENPAEEVALLSRGQIALRSGRFADALRATQEHRARFAKGALAEERDVLAIDALVQLGRKPEAERMANQFRRAYPSSGYTQRLNQLTGSESGQP